MLPNWLVALLLMIQEAFSVRRDAHFRFMKLQVEMMKERMPGNRVILTPEERQRLMKVGAELGHTVHDVLSIVSGGTYRRWQREVKAGKEAKKVGRPAIAKSLRDMIVKLARENANWGILRILGELKKLSLKAGESTVRRVLKEEKILPDPDRRAPKGTDTPWRKFLATHMNVMVACDFFGHAISARLESHFHKAEHAKNRGKTKIIFCRNAFLNGLIWSPLGKKMAYVLAFIHLGSRKVFITPSTYTPTAEWVQQQARNASMWADEEGIDIRFMIHDRDTKFTEAFDEHFKRPDGKTVLTPVRAPNANAFSESFGGKLKSEVLNHVFCFCLRQLDYVCQTYATYHNNFRPHQGLGNRPPGSQPPDAQTDPPQLDTEIDHRLVKRKSWLGGLLRHYERKAA